MNITINNICVYFVFVLFSIESVLVVGRSLLEGVAPNVYKIKRFIINSELEEVR
jgi:hypothetical protein